MASTRQPVPEIQSWTPALDARTVENGTVFVLEGKNYDFDTKGPKSGFGALLLAGEPLDPGTLFPYQSVTLAGRAIVFSGKGAYERRRRMMTINESALPQDYWKQLLAFEVQDESRVGQARWTGAYVGRTRFLAYPGLGLFKLQGESLVKVTVPGLPEDIIGVAESSGRLIVLGKYTVTYSSAQSPEDFVPELGGAGFQVLSERVPGVPFAVTSFQGGFIVWTKAGILLAEYVGGETVFRFERIISEQLMLNQNSWTNLTTGENIILTSQGLFRSSATSGMSPLTPEFNEFLRDRVKLDSSFSVRLDYADDTDQLYFAVMDSSATFSATYVLSVGLDKWGEFSFQHKGLVRFAVGSNQIGWFDHYGNARMFRNVPFVEGPNGLQALESEIRIGYIRPAEGAQQADVEFEMQEIVVSATETVSDEANLVEEDWNYAGAFTSWNIGFYSADEDYNGLANPFYGIDYNDSGPGEDYNLAPTYDPVEDYLVFYEGDTVWYSAVDDLVVYGLIDENDYSPQSVVDYNNPGSAQDFNLTPEGGVDTSWYDDWNKLEAGESNEDWNGFQSFIMRINYGIEVGSNLDGYAPVLTVIPSLAVRKAKTDLWTLFNSGQNHTIRFQASAAWEKFHIRQLAITINYQGQIS